MPTGYNTVMPESLLSRLHPPEHAEIPASHLGLHWRNPQIADGPALQKLVLKSEFADQVTRYTDSERLAQMTGAGMDKRYLHSLVGIDDNKRVQAVGAVFIDPEEKEVARAELFAVTAKKWRGRGIGRALLAWQLAEARRMLVDIYGPDSTIPAQISNVIEGKSIERRRLYMAAGFKRLGQLLQMSHDLQSLPELNVPKGIHLRRVNVDYLAKMHRMHKDRVSTRKTTDSQHEQWWLRAMRHIDLRLSFVAVDDADNVIGFAITAVNPVSILAQSKVQPVIELLEVDVDYRNRGLERTLITKVLQAAAKHQTNRVSLDTYLNGEAAFIASVEDMGFKESGTRLIYTIEV